MRTVGLIVKMPEKTKTAKSGKKSGGGKVAEK